MSFWSAATDGAQRGRSISKPGINLSNGLFTIDLPLSGPDLAAVFGNGTNAVYIEVTAAGKTYPRQRFLYTPLALRVPVDESHLEYSDTNGKLRIKMDSGATDGSVMTSDGRGGFTWKKIDATQLVAKNESNAAPSDKQVLTYSSGKWIAADPSQSSNTLTSISGIAPITVAGSGTAPSISIAKASGTASGYLSSGDWSTFNSKQDALGFAPLNKAGDTLGGTLNMNGKALTGLAMPADASDAASKSYVDGLALRQDGTVPLTAAWNVGGKDITNTGDITMADGRTLGLSKNSTDPSFAASSDKGKIWFNSTSNDLRYWDGSTVKTLGMAGSGLQNLNGQTNNSQSLATGWSSGTAPNWVSSAGTHTLHVPLASTAGVAAGLISAADYTTFHTKLGSVAAGGGMQVSTVGTTATVSLPVTGTAGTYTKVTTDAYGRITTGTSLAAADLPPHSAGLITSGTLSVANGGTGLNTAPTNGQLLIGNAGNFALGTLNQGAKAGVSIASGAGSITLDTAQDIRATASPTFANLTASSLTAPVMTQSATSVPTLSAAGQGKIYFDQTDNEFKISQNGGAYTKLASGGTVTNIATGTGLTGGPITATGSISLSNTAVTPGSYTRANISVDAQGRLTAAQSAAAIVDADVAASAAIAQSKISG
ncbi:MAG: hypothetical protein FJ146_19570, partial [Deltaproteobacteria bacterium]|nr:hypothetical protein [Deltaproteobacteria bacterium]